MYTTLMNISPLSGIFGFQLKSMISNPSRLVSLLSLRIVLLSLFWFSIAFSSKSRAFHALRMSDESRTLFCGNLSDKVTEELLYELFLQAGPIDEVRIPKQRSFGFVTYRHEATIPYALNLYSGTRLYGREINIALRSQQSPGNDREHQGNSLGHGLRGLGNPMAQHMMPQMRPPATNPNTMFGCVLDMDQLLKFGQQLNANFQGSFGGASSSRGDYYGDNRGRELVNRDKHYRNRDREKPYGSRRQRDADNDKGKNPRNNFRDRHYRR